jgi:hypothetical protein
VGDRVKEGSAIVQLEVSVLDKHRQPVRGLTQKDFTIFQDGKLQRIGNDLDFDGHVDRWDRDEIALREIAEKERVETEAEQKKAAQEKARESGGVDAGATDARVSARRRQ